MAQKKQIALRKQQLTSQLAGSRESLSQGQAVIKDSLTVKRKVTTLVKGKIQSKPKAIFAGSAVLALIATLAIRRKGKKKSTQPAKKLLTGLAIKLAKPAAKKWAKKRIQSYAVNKLRSVVQQRQMGTEESQLPPIS